MSIKNIQYPIVVLVSVQERQIKSFLTDSCAKVLCFTNYAIFQLDLLLVAPNKPLKPSLHHTNRDIKKSCKQKHWHFLTFDLCLYWINIENSWDQRSCGLTFILNFSKFGHLWMKYREIYCKIKPFGVILVSNRYLLLSWWWRWWWQNFCEYSNQKKFTVHQHRSQ